MSKKLSSARFLLAVSAILVAGTASAADYVIDSEGNHASIVFKFKHLGISWLTGEFRDFDGSFSFDEESPEASTVNVNIRTASIDSNHAERDEHMRSADYLDTDTYPTATFVSKRIMAKDDGGMTIIGDLTLHGQTNEIEIAASVTGAGGDPWGGYRTGFEGTTVLDTSAFGMRFPPTNEVLLELYLEGIRQ